jgi:hypothetical protein
MRPLLSARPARRTASHRPGRSRAALRLLCIASGLAGCARAFAAADDLSAMDAPVGASAPATSQDAAAPGRKAAAKGVIPTAARRLIEDVMQTERAVAEVLRDNVVSRVMASSWRVGVGAPFVTRATGLPIPASLATPVPESTLAITSVPDTPLGARWRVVRADADTHVPAVSWMPNSQVANASAVRPKTYLSGDWALPGDFSVGVMPGMATDTGPQGRRQTSGTLAVTIGKTWSPQWRTFVDMARDRLDTTQMNTGNTTVDAGVSFAANSTTQIDFALTHGLSETAAPMQAGVGVSSSF